MKQILCFGDSNTWGYNGETGDRYQEEERWTTILQKKLGTEEYRVIEDGLCGRTTVFEDPYVSGRCGSAALPVALQACQPLDAIVLMLGTNDCKAVFQANAEKIGRGIEVLLDQIREGAPQAKVLLISPIFLGEKVWHEEYDLEFSRESVEVSKQLSKVYEEIAARREIGFMRASDYAWSGEADQEHMDRQGHVMLAEGICKVLKENIL